MNFLPIEIENKIWRHYYATIYDDTIKEFEEILSTLLSIESNMIHIKNHMRQIRFHGLPLKVERINSPQTIIEKTRLQLDFIHRKNMCVLLPTYMRKIPYVIPNKISRIIPKIYVSLAYVLTYRCNYQLKAVRYFRNLLIYSQLLK